MRSVAELRAINAKNLAMQDDEFCEVLGDELRDADIFREPRYWMTFEEWCEFVESDEDFDKMEKRERARIPRQTGVECVQLCTDCQRRADRAYKRLGSFKCCAVCESAIAVWRAKHGNGGA